MTVDTASAPEAKKPIYSTTKRNRIDVIRQVREITGLDDQSINQTIEACKDDTGRYSLEQVISLLFDDNLKNNLQQRAPCPPIDGKTSQTSHSKTGAAQCTDSDSTTASKEHQPDDSLTDDVIDMSADLDNPPSSPDEDLERALQLSRETVESIIDESDVAERKSPDEPAGLKNIGNTCWFNSIVQALYNLPYFRRLILNFRYVPIDRKLTDIEQQAISFTEELRCLFVLLLKSIRRSINPERALKKFKNTRKLSGIDFSHEDCSEFALHLIDLVELAFEVVGKNLINTEISTNPVNNLVTGEVTVERNETKFIREALRQINIQMIDSSNLYDGLETLWLGSADEIVTNQQPIVEQHWLTRLPPVLFICLNRYRFSPTTKQTAKISAPFEFYPELFLDRYMLTNRNLILQKRQIARSLYAQLHELENTLNSYLKYSCNNESFALANAIRVVYEYATGCRLNPSLPKRTDSLTTNPTSTTRPRATPMVSLRPSQISDDELQIIQNTLPTWLTEIEAKCSQLREEIRRVQNELKQLYDEPTLQKVRYTLHAVSVHEGSASLGHFWTYVFHNDRKKWFRYNDNEVTECQWNDVFDSGIGAEREIKRSSSSAYLLVYINAEQRCFSSNTKFDLTVDLQQVLDEDFQLLQKQNETLRLDQLHQHLKHFCERLDKSSPTDRVLSLPFFTGPNRFCDAELVRPSVDSTFRLLRNFETKILSNDLRQLLIEMIDKEIKTYDFPASMIASTLLHQDLRLQHVLVYFSANRIEQIYRQRLVLDLIRLSSIPQEETRLRIFKYEAQMMCNETKMTDDEAQEYQKILTDYKDYRSVIAAFLAGCQLMREEKFDEAITYFCVACEYNIRLSARGSLPMRAMDSSLLFRTRRLCFDKWNENVLNRFKTDSNYQLDTMTHKFVPCLMQLKLSSEEDQLYIGEIQRIWCFALDNIEPTERSKSLELFLQRLFEQPIGQHFHSVSINKNQLIERYEETVRELIHRYSSAVCLTRTTENPPSQTKSSSS